LNCHIGRIALGSMGVRDSVWLGWSGIRVAGFYFTSYVLNMYRTLIYPSSGACGISVAGFSLPHGYHSNPTTPKLQHTSNQEQCDQCGNSTE